MSVPRDLEKTVQKVLSKKGFPNAAIGDDVFEEALSEEDVSYIAQTMQGWQTFLPTLGIPLQDGRDIDNDNIRLSSPLQKRIAVLTKFTQLHGVDATYKKLILAFCKAKRNDLVSKVLDRVAERLKNQIPEDSPAASNVSQASRVQSSSTAIKARKLDTHNIIEVLMEGEFSAADCETFGMNLGVKTYTIKNIVAQRHGRVELELIDILDHWLHNDLQASWDKVAEALRKSGYKNLAVAISGERQAEVSAKGTVAGRVVESNEEEAISDEEDVRPTNAMADVMESNEDKIRNADCVRPRQRLRETGKADKRKQDRKDEGRSQSQLTAAGGRKMAFYVFVAVILALFGASWIYMYYVYFPTTHHTSPTPDTPSPDDNPTPPSDIVEFPSKQITSGDATVLFSELQSIGDWHSLCKYLGVDDSSLVDIDYSDQKPYQKRQKCLTYYIDAGKADWKTVVTVVAKYPFKKVNLSCDIARKYLNIEEKTCKSLLERLK